MIVGARAIAQGTVLLAYLNRNLQARLVNLNSQLKANLIIVSLI